MRKANIFTFKGRDGMPHQTTKVENLLLPTFEDNVLEGLWQIDESGRAMTCHVAQKCILVNRIVKKSCTSFYFLSQRVSRHYVCTTLV
ncbi:hypothetical protein GIB67_039776 [Kingdonia uniflora]|uniref:Uncharacterized protein n=1 Tax=Kingdonia uniflora TaxID=39325 RepID=A0A7J7MPZ7_9MAGN|nr:hypothetical protein GIB67_039776 [Kingdonia uniflora]